MNSENNEVVAKVVDRYGKFAQEVLDSNQPLPLNRDGFEPFADRSSGRLAARLYRAKDLIDLPEPAINASIGCGNPLALADLRGGETVLDLGSGGGLDCFQAAKAVGPSGRVIGVDATPKMIALANQNKAKMGVKNVTFHLANIEKLPLESDFVDLVISNCVIDIVPDKAAVFSEAFRVLKSGGRLAITDTVLMGDLSKQLKANIDRWTGAIITPLISLTDFLDFILQAGFVAVQVKSLTSYGLENFAKLDEESQTILTTGLDWQPLPLHTGVFCAAIVAQKPDS